MRTNLMSGLCFVKSTLFLVVVVVLYVFIDSGHIPFKKNSMRVLKPTITTPRENKVSKALNDEKHAMEEGNFKAARFHRKRVQLFTDQVCGVVGIVTYVFFPRVDCAPLLMNETIK
jgi:hypothetical protein